MVTPSGYRLRFFSSVLHLRGPSTFKQPVVDADSGDVFLWNGQVFEGLQQHETSGSDTEVLWNRLGSARKEGKGADAVRDVLAGVEGPYVLRRPLPSLTRHPLIALAFAQMGIALL